MNGNITQIKNDEVIELE